MAFMSVCVQQVQGGGPSERRQVHADVSVFGDAAGVPPPELRPPPGHGQSHQHDDNDHGSNRPTVITKDTNTTVISTPETDCTVGNVVQPVPPPADVYCHTFPLCTAAVTVGLFQKVTKPVGHPRNLKFRMFQTL